MSILKKLRFLICNFPAGDFTNTTGQQIPQRTTNIIYPRKLISCIINQWHTVSELVWGLLVIVIVEILGYRLLSLTVKHSVNLLFWDKFDLYTPLINGQGILPIFFEHHPIGQQGLAAVIEQLLMVLTNWNIAYVCLFVYILLFICCEMGLLMKIKITGRLGWESILIPYLVLSTSHFEILVVDPYPPAVLACLGVFFVCYSWALQGRWRYIGVTIGTFLTFYSASGFVIWPIIAVLFLIDGYQHHKTTKRIPGTLVWCSLLLIGMLISFFVGFSVDNMMSSTIPINIQRFLTFLLFMFIGRFDVYRTESSAILQGGIVCGSIVFLNIFSFFRLLRGSVDKKYLYRSIWILSSYSLIFAVLAAFGRYMLPLEDAFTSRYIIYIIPGYFAIFYTLLTIPKRLLRTVTLAALIILFGITEGNYSTDHTGNMTYYSNNKRKWVACYLKYEDKLRCDRLNDFTIFPKEGNPQMEQVIESKLNFMKINRLNLFSEKP